MARSGRPERDLRSKAHVPGPGVAWVSRRSWSGVGWQDPERSAWLSSIAALEQRKDWLCRPVLCGNELNALPDELGFASTGGLRRCRQRALLGQTQSIGEQPNG